MFDPGGVVFDPGGVVFDPGSLATPPAGLDGDPPPKRFPSNAIPPATPVRIPMLLQNPLPTCGSLPSANLPLFLLSKTAFVAFSNAFFSSGVVSLLLDIALLISS